MKKNDIILLFSVIIISAIALIVLYAVFNGTANTVVVTVDGKEYLRLPLDTDTEVTVNGYNGGTNILVIKDGKAYIREASCPDKVCVRSGNADELHSVVCAPNRTVISIETDK